MIKIILSAVCFGIVSMSPSWAIASDKVKESAYEKYEKSSHKSKSVGHKAKIPKHLKKSAKVKKHKSKSVGSRHVVKGRKLASSPKLVKKKIKSGHQ